MIGGQVQLDQLRQFNVVDLLGRRPVETDIAAISGYVKGKVVLVDFWAPWCGPCRTLGPILEKIAAAANGRWVFAKVNVDEHTQVATEQEISGIPDVRLFHKGVVLGSFSGVRSERDIHKFLEHHLPSPRAAEVAEARLLMEEQRFGDAAQKLEALLQTEPRNDAARMALAYWGRPISSPGSKRPDPFTGTDTRRRSLST